MKEELELLKEGKGTFLQLHLNGINQEVFQLRKSKDLGGYKEFNFESYILLRGISPLKTSGISLFPDVCQYSSHVLLAFIFNGSSHSKKKKKEKKKSR